MDAVYMSREAIIKLLLENGAGAEAKDNNSWMLFSIAEERKCYAITELLRRDYMSSI